MKYFLFIIFLLGINAQIFSQEETKNPILTDKFYIEAGAFFPSKNIKLGADASSPDDEIDFNGTLGLNDNETTYFVNFEWRWNKKWRLTAETFAVNNARKAVLDSTIVFDNITFEEGTNVRAGVEFSLYRIFVGRLISSGQKHSLGAGLGVHALNVGAFVEGNILSDNPEIDGEFRRARVSALIPLPNIGAWYHWAPNNKWAVITRLDWFGLTIDQYSGGLWNISPGFRYQIVDRFGLGIDYRFLLFNARVDQDNWKGSFNMDFTGPTITLHGNF
ncbi:hypothetical protein [Lutimonas zeaxanthinifaciens]|uniref:hypothetical protein n=1 Tax=Lutimonas zeaxanthinifaciens TaxID=3060215 RepID=UPI00265CA72E|nr:hypothetical protein [Lutimonas sp. YSD2104]WKK67315.1 hypothetical protein QZH61_06730 [Lutimonas sp. YSD2104]